MSCPTCDSTMRYVGGDHEDECSVYHCPRCGTVQINDSETVYTPELVDRCREFKKQLGCSYGSEWNPIAEAIHKPEDRT